MTAVLRAQNVSFSYGTRAVLHDVALELHAGELLGLLGPNGAGKTTLLHVLSGYLQAGEGIVHTNGRLLAELSRREAAQQIAVVPQHAASTFAFTVMQVVLMGRHPYCGFASVDSPGDVRIAEESLARAGLAGFEDRRFDQLSGGEQRLVLIARALAQQTPIVLLDEPLAELDLRHQSEILTLLRQLCVDGKAVLATFHDINAAARWCDRVALLNRGQVAGVGTPAETLTPETLKQVYGVELEWSTQPRIEFAG